MQHLLGALSYIALPHRLCTFAVALFLSACSVSSVSQLFISYSSELKEGRASLQQASPASALTQLPKHRDPQRYYLSQLERGRVAFLLSDTAQSQRAFNEVHDHQKQLFSLPQYRLSSGLASLSSLLTNDNALAYHIPPFELAAMYAYQAVNYLQLNSLEGALIELRRANQLLAQAQNEKPQSLEQQLRAYQQSYTELLNTYPSDSIRSTLESPYQLALVHVLSGVLYNAAGQANDAYISYRKALALQPKHEGLQRELARLGQRLGLDYRTYTTQPAQAMKANEGLLVVIAEKGLIKARQELKFSVPYIGRQWRYYNVALPVYASQPIPDNALAFQWGGQYFQAPLISDFDALARRQLAETLPHMLMRQMLRLVSKDQLRREVGEQSDTQALSNLLVNLYNLATERADTRHWQTLPQAAYFSVSPRKAGEQTFSLPALGLGPQRLALRAGRTTLVFIDALGFMRVFQL